jgi:diguanylate cyclase (GGDEF)-like protein
MNDTLGHENGDYVIKQAADYIKQFTDDSSFCFRMGGDEFLLVMCNCTYQHMDNVTDILDTDAPVILSHENDSVQCALSYGYAYGKDKFSYEIILAEAEENMYKKKKELKQILNMPDR